MAISVLKRMGIKNQRKSNIHKMRATGQDIIDQEELILSVLSEGKIEVAGQFVFGSNYSFLANLSLDDMILEAVYKPIRGGYPLWDFSLESLPFREVAAYQTSRALKWNFIPPTVIREDAPFGIGSLQLFIDHDPEINYFNLEGGDRAELDRVVLFDIIINNADRKASHILKDESGYLWLIDHGLCFHSDQKLRTIIWDYSGEEISKNLLEVLKSFNENIELHDDLRQIFLSNISSVEVKAMQKRIQGLLASRIFPHPEENRRSYPWPLV